MLLDSKLRKVWSYFHNDDLQACVKASRTSYKIVGIALILSIVIKMIQYLIILKTFLWIRWDINSYEFAERYNSALSFSLLNIKKYTRTVVRGQCFTVI